MVTKRYTTSDNIVFKLSKYFQKFIIDPTVERDITL